MSLTSVLWAMVWAVMCILVLGGIRWVIRREEKKGEERDEERRMFAQELTEILSNPSPSVNLLGRALQSLRLLNFKSRSFYACPIPFGDYETQVMPRTFHVIGIFDREALPLLLLCRKGYTEWELVYGRSPDAFLHVWNALATFVQSEEWQYEQGLI